MTLAVDTNDDAFNMQGMRVALVGPVPPPAGGMAGQTAQLAELLAGEGIEVRLVPVNEPCRPAWVGKLKGLRAAYRLFPYVTKLWHAAGWCDVMHVMANSGWSWHLLAAPAIWVGRLRRVPVIVNYRGGEANTFLTKAARSVRFSMKQAARLIVPSGFLQEVFHRFGMTAEIVPNIIDLARFYASGPSDRRSLRGLHIVVARNLEPLYDIATALRAFSQICVKYPEAQLSVAGSGPELANLRALANDLKIADSVHFTGRLDRSEMAALYRQSDLLLNPSLADNMPNSLLEALASGVPVVSTCVGGVPYIVQDGETAMLVPPADPQAMAAAALRVLENPQLQQRLIAAGQVAVSRYAWPMVRPVLMCVYRKACPSLERLRAA